MIYKWAARVLCLVASLSIYSGALDAREQKRVEQKTDAKLQVVTTFSILADLVRQVGGEHIDVHTLVDWDEDAHVYHPAPSDVRYLAKADLLVVNGLGFEGWLERLITSSKFKGQLVTATAGIEVIKLGSKNSHDGHSAHQDQDEHGDHNDHGQQQGVDPHAWHSLIAVKVYIQNILNTLIKLDSRHQSYYQANAAQYMVKLNGLAAETSKNLGKLSEVQRNIVMPHNAFAYLARDYDLHVYSLKSTNAESEASAAQIAQVIRKIKAENIQAVFSETTADDRLIKLVQQETAAFMGGALISGALSRKLAPTYLEMMRYNIERITQALSE